MNHQLGDSAKPNGQLPYTVTNCKSGHGRVRNGPDGNGLVALAVRLQSHRPEIASRGARDPTGGRSLGTFRDKQVEARALRAPRNEAALALAEKEQRLDADPATWEKIEANATMPPDAEFLLADIRAIGPAPSALSDDPFPSHFADTVVLNFHLPLRPSDQAGPP